ncbi:MAG: 3-phenylpropionate MFS transporter [Alphaproteobacteria bacterium]|nr:3-phenylpropionate MFS transporter [Alphaproteobacteria bacterium]
MEQLTARRMTMSASPNGEQEVSDRSIAVRMSVFYFAVFLSAGLYLPFWPVWLESRGLGPVEIGLLYAIGRFTRILTNPLIAHVVDRRGDRRKPMVLLSLGATVAFAAYELCSEMWQFALVAVVVGAMWGTINPLGDSLALVNARQGRLNYGRVRLWGSISFILATLAGGQILDVWPESAIFWSLLATFAVVTVVCLITPDTRVEALPVQSNVFRVFWRLMSEPRFALFILASALLQTSHLVVYIFGTLHWRDAGIDDFIIGVLWAEGVVAEIVLFSFGAALTARFGAAGLLMMAAVAGVMRWPLLAFSTDLSVLFVAQALHGVTFGAAHLGAMAFLSRAIPPSLSATAQTLHGAVALGVASAVISPLLGGLYESWGGGAFYIMTLFSLAGGVVAFIAAQRWNGETLDL